MDIPILDNKGLRNFGLTTGVIIVLLFAFFFPWVFDVSIMPTWPWIAAAVLWLPALLFPSILRPVYTTWMKIGLGLGWVNTRIILGILFYAIVLPMGLIMKILRYDPMARSRDEAALSYRKDSVIEDKDRLENPY